MHRRFHRRVTLLTGSARGGRRRHRVRLRHDQPLGQSAEHEMITRAALDCPVAPPSGACFEPKSISRSPATSAPWARSAHPTCRPRPRRALRRRRLPARRRPAQSPRRRNRAARGVPTPPLRPLPSRNPRAPRDARRQGSADRRQVDLSTRSCTFVGGFRGRAKCNALEGFGRALHGVQDFYSHSNWADEADPARPIGPFNPPGLGHRGLAPHLALRAAVMPTVPRDLATGCFSFTSSPCRGRITHSALAKDSARSTRSPRRSERPSSGRAPQPPSGAARSLVGSNFQQAVSASIADTRRQWNDFKSELRSHWGAKRANLMICALTG